MVRVVQFGLGAIGVLVTQALNRRDDLEIVGAIDANPALVGRDLGDVTGLDRQLGVALSDDVESVLDGIGAPVVLHSTVSSIAAVQPQLEACLRAGMNVISTCEELSYPWIDHAEIAQSLHELAVSNGVSLLGTGVNPGFVMDLLPLTLTGVCQDVRTVRVQRTLDASTRRLPFQLKIGAGMSVEEFDAKARAGGIGHVGLRESVALVAAGIGWELDEIQDEISAVLADRPMSTDHVEVGAGQVAGLRQAVRGIVQGREAILLDIQMSIGADEPRDAVQLEATPPIDLVIRGGTHGDAATVAILLNTIEQAIQAQPGLLTALDLPMVTARKTTI